MKTRQMFAAMLSILVLAASLTPTIATHAAAADPLRGIDDCIEKVMADWKVPGLAMAVVKDDQVILSKGYGIIEAGKLAPVDVKT